LHLWCNNKHIVILPYSKNLWDVKSYQRVKNACGILQGNLLFKLV
jgi:hypothetical protein